LRYCNENNDLKVFFRWNKNQITILVYSLLGIHIYTKPIVSCIAMHINILYHTRGSELVSMLWIIIQLFIFLHSLRWCSLRVHWYGLPPVCILLCSIRLHFSEKSFITLSALIWFISHVCSKQVQTTSVWKRFIKVSTLIWFISSVCPHVFFKMTFMKKTFVTLTALIRFLTNMCPHMIYK